MIIPSLTAILILCVTSLSTKVLASKSSFDHSAKKGQHTKLNIVTWEDFGCLKDGNMTANIRYGYTYDDLVQSYQLSRDLEDFEQLDFSQGSDFDRPNCARFLETANPDSNDNTLRKDTCYDLTKSNGITATLARNGKRGEAPSGPCPSGLTGKLLVSLDKIIDFIQLEDLNVDRTFSSRIVGPLTMDYEDNSFDALERSCADNFFDDYFETDEPYAHHDSGVNFIDFSKSGNLSHDISENKPQPYDFPGFLASGPNLLPPSISNTWAQESDTGLSNPPDSSGFLHIDWNLLTLPEGFASSGPTSGVSALELVDVMPLYSINTYSSISCGSSGPSAPILGSLMRSDSHVEPEFAGIESVVCVYPEAQRSFEHTDGRLPASPPISRTNSKFSMRRAEQLVSLANDLSSYIEDQFACGASGACKRKRAKSPSAFQGCSAFPVAGEVLQKPKRVKFQSDRRQKVAQIRRKGACLRCKYLKISEEHSATGAKVLEYLETLLSKIALAKAPLEDLRATLLMIFSTIMIVCLITVSESENQTETFKAGQQLLRILLHQFILVAETIDMLNSHVNKSCVANDVDFNQDWDDIFKRQSLETWWPASEPLYLWESGRSLGDKP